MVHYSATQCPPPTSPCQPNPANHLYLAIHTRQEAPAGNLTRLADRRPVPAQFSDAQALLQEEGASYYWL